MSDDALELEANPGAVLFGSGSGTGLGTGVPPATYSRWTEP